MSANGNQHRKSARFSTRAPRVLGDRIRQHIRYDKRVGVDLLEIGERVWRTNKWLDGL